MKVIVKCEDTGLEFGQYDNMSEALFHILYANSTYQCELTGSPSECDDKMFWWVKANGKNYTFEI